MFQTRNKHENESHLNQCHFVPFSPQVVGGWDSLKIEGKPLSPTPFSLPPWGFTGALKHASGLHPCSHRRKSRHHSLHCNNQTRMLETRPTRTSPRQCNRWKSKRFLLRPSEAIRDACFRIAGKHMHIHLVYVVVFAFDFSHKDIYLYGAVWDYSSPTLARANQHCTICKTNVGRQQTWLSTKTS